MDRPSGPFVLLGTRSTVLKKERLKATVVTVADFGDPATKLVGGHKIAVRTVPRRPDGDGYEYTDTIARWMFGPRESERLIAFLRGESVPLIDDPAALDESGAPGEPAAPAARGEPDGPAEPDVRVVSADSREATLLDAVAGGAVDIDSLIATLTQRNDVGAVVTALSATDEGLSAAEGAVISQRRELIARLRQLAEDPRTTESDLQRVMGHAFWLFGGRYVGIADRYLGAPDQHDMALLSADGTLHVVELKGPNIPSLVRQHRKHWIVGADVHEATSQAMNYLRALDEKGSGRAEEIFNDTGIKYDLRRTFATVVIGHPAHVTNVGPHKHIIEQAIRSYNAHLSRVEVITYASLLDAAERALEFEDTARAGPAGPA
jgi:hypothetical protein